MRTAQTIRYLLPYVTITVVFVLILQEIRVRSRLKHELLHKQQATEHAATQASTTKVIRFKQLPKHAYVKHCKNYLNEKQPWLALHDYNVLIYSAFDDRRAPDKPVVRLVLYKNFGIKHEATCDLRLSDNSTMTVKGTFDSINKVSPFCPGGCEWRYESFYLTCPFPRSAGQPLSVSVAVKNESTPSIGICPVIATDESRLHTLSMCMPAIWAFDDWFRLVLFVEYYRFSGVTHFVAYNHSSSQNVQNVMRFYSNRGLLQILPWPKIPHADPEPPFVNKFEGISNRGQIVNSNDCILRVSPISRYVALLDVDEFIGAAGQVTEDWLAKSVTEMMPSTSSTGGLQYRSAFAFPKWPPKRELRGPSSSVNVSVPISGSVTMGEIQRPGYRSKMIFRPEGVLKQSVHQPWAYMPGFHERVVDPKQGLIYHMRRNLNSAGSKPVVDNPFGPVEKTLKRQIETTIKTIKYEYLENEPM